MDFSKLLSDMAEANSPRGLAKAELSIKADNYFKRMEQITTIAVNLYTIDKEAGEAFMEKFTDTITTLTNEVNSMFEKFQKEHGEL